MKRFELLLFCLLWIFTLADCFGISNCIAKNKPNLLIDSISQHDRQLLYNGRIWRNQYSNIAGGEFLFSKEFLNGNVTIRGKTFYNVSLRYDIFNDEIISFPYPGMIIQLNKERIDGFDLTYENKHYKFTNLRRDSSNIINGYANILYRGSTGLYLKFKKEIEKSSLAKMYEEFYLIQGIYLMKDGKFYRVYNKRDLVRLLKDKSQQIKNFMKQKKIRVVRNKPETFIPVLEFYDSLHQ